MDRALSVSHTGGYEGCKAHTGGPGYRAVGGGRCIAGDFEVLQSGSREEFSALLDGLRADGVRCLELLDACDTLDPEALDELATAVMGHIVNEIDCGDEWATFMLGFLFHLKNKQKNLAANQRRVFDVLLVKVNEFNALHDRVRAFVRQQELHEEVERRRQELEAETECVRQEEEEATERLRGEAAQQRLADEAETERLQQEGLEELELLRHMEPMDWRKVASRIPLVGWLFRKSESAPAGQDQANLADVNQGHVNFS
ncbi:MAG: DUF4670 domain-containing protein [Puniceicoccales bacterium]|nr:DUF4670 domain-containing protein [Puniceicoccales bacterium]